MSNENGCAAVKAVEAQTIDISTDMSHTDSYEINTFPDRSSCCSLLVPRKYQFKKLAIQTRWIVLTGTPSSGKTELLKRMSAGGYRCAPEFARTYFEQELGKGRTIEEIRSNVLQLRKKLIEGTTRTERELDPNQLVILDRAIPDNFAFAYQEGLNPNELMAKVPSFRYRLIFQLEPLPLENDGVRELDLAKRQQLNEINLEVYQSLGYKIIYVPRFSGDKEESITRRYEFVRARMDAELKEDSLIRAGETVSQEALSA